LQRYLSQLQNEQVAFNVKQRKLRTIEAAVIATLERESYLVRSYNSDAAIAPVQMESKRDDALMEMMTQLMARMDRLEGNSKCVHPKQESTLTDQVKSREVVCYHCGQEGHFARGCAQGKKPSNQGNESPYGRLPQTQGKP